MESHAGQNITGPSGFPLVRLKVFAAIGTPASLE